jgi:hypothetical protein
MYFPKGLKIICFRRELDGQGNTEWMGELAPYCLFNYLAVLGGNFGLSTLATG